jgi:hypothetical protein
MGQVCTMELRLLVLQTLTLFAFYSLDPSPNTLQLSDAELDAESDARTLAEAFSLELQSMEDTLTDWKRGMRERDWMEQKSRNNPRKFAEFGDEMVFQNWCLCRTKMSVLHQNVRLMMDRIGNECNAYSSWIQLYKRAARLERTFERTDSILGEELLLWEAGEGVWQSMYEDGSLIWQN